MSRISVDSRIFFALGCTLRCARGCIRPGLLLVQKGELTFPGTGTFTNVESLWTRSMFSGFRSVCTR